MTAHDNPGDEAWSQNGVAGEFHGSRRAYIRQAQSRLQDTRRRLDAVGDKVELIVRSKARLDICLATIDRRLALLHVSDDDDWSEPRRSLDDAWDELARALQNLIRQIS